MSQVIVIVGAGIIGAATALSLARAGRRVTVLAGTAPMATDASFGWINASFFLDEDHHRLRAEAIAAWHRVSGGLSLPVAWQGCLCWDADLPELEAMQTRLTALGYPARMLTRREVAVLEPAVSRPPEHALQFETEGAVTSADVPAIILRAAQAAGAQVVRGLNATALDMFDGACRGVVTDAGRLSADHVILAAGTGSEALARSAGTPLPMVRRPAYMMRTQSVRPCLTRVLATPEGEIRQEPDGRILMPTATGHQGDASDRLHLSPREAAEDAMVRLRGLMLGLEAVTWAEVLRAERPVPADGRPVVGPLAPGLYAAVLHSGITLGPLVGELVARDLMGETEAATWLDRYRPARFR